MNLVQRKPRPLRRDAESLRDDRLFLVATDDTYAPRQYFEFFKFRRVKVYVIPSVGGQSSAAHVLERLREFEYEEDDELWMLLDTDHYTEGSHLGSFLETLRKAKRQGVNVALSRPCFELWLLLHHQDGEACAPLPTAAHVEEALRNRLGQYNKTNLRRQDYPDRSVVEAYIRASEMDCGTIGKMIPETNTSRVHLLWKAIMSKTLPSQLSGDLRRLHDWITAAGPGPDPGS